MTPSEIIEKAARAAFDKSHRWPYQKWTDLPEFARENWRTAIEAAIRSIAPGLLDGTQWIAPVEDTNEMWDGLARQIVMWDRFPDPTGKALHDHLRGSGWEIPAWLPDLIPEIAKVPPKGAVAGAIYRAMRDVYRGDYSEKKRAVL